MPCSVGYAFEAGQISAEEMRAGPSEGPAVVDVLLGQPTPAGVLIPGRATQPGLQASSITLSVHLVSNLVSPF